MLKGELLLLIAGYDFVAGQKCKSFNPSGYDLCIYLINLFRPLSAKATGPIINVPYNYNLSFNIRPTGINPEYGSIIQFSATQQASSRTPALW